MQQNQPQPEFGQDHIVRRLISKFRKPSDASAIGIPSTFSGLSNNSLQVPGGGGEGLASLSAADLASGQASGGGSGSSSLAGGGDHGGGPSTNPLLTTQSSIAGKLATKQNRWSQLVATAAAGAAAKQQQQQSQSHSSAATTTAPTTTSTNITTASKLQHQLSGSGGHHLDLGHHAGDHHGTRAGSSAESTAGGATGSNRSSSDKDIRSNRAIQGPSQVDDDIDENYFKAGGRGHQTILDNMDKR